MSINTINSVPYVSVDKNTTLVPATKQNNSLTSAITTITGYGEILTLLPSIPHIPSWMKGSKVSLFGNTCGVVNSTVRLSSDLSQLSSNTSYFDKAQKTMDIVGNAIDLTQKTVNVLGAFTAISSTTLGAVGVLSGVGQAIFVVNTAFKVMQMVKDNIK